MAELPWFGHHDINPEISYYVHRQAKAQEILDQVSTSGTVLIRAGFFSGKSSFVHSIEREAKKDYKDNVYSFSVLDVHEHLRKDWPEDFGDVVRIGTGGKIDAKKFHHICDCETSKQSCLFIIDEAQVCSKQWLLSLFY